MHNLKHDSHDQVQALEQALLARAASLAEEKLQRARHARDRILNDEGERLRVREERELASIRTVADRLYRRKVQEAELKLRANLDQTRWRMVQSLMEQLFETLKEITQDSNQEHYLALLQRFLAQAAHAIEQDRLICYCNATDRARLVSIWGEFSKKAAPIKQIVLSPETKNFLGGLLLMSDDRRVAVDNTFEGRIERFSSALHQVVMERLFASTASMDALLHG